MLMRYPVGEMYSPLTMKIPDLKTDLYPFFRALSLKHIIVLFEAAISEARIIFRSSYPAMLHSASRALLHLLWPFKFSGVYIPILPSRLLSALEVLPHCHKFNLGSCELYYWHRSKV